MDKKGHTQLELFSRAKGTAGLMPQTRHSFLGFIWNYEKAILIIVGFIITATVSFALGVEKGKRTATLKSRPRAFMASGEDAIKQATTPLPAPAQAKPEPQLKPAPTPRQEVVATPAALVKESAASYTIQVASFKKEASAQREIDTLKKKGLVASILSKGKYLVVCVGSFMQKDEAKKLLSELKKRYQDCFIRRL
jgi:cell division protein FtsN